MLLTDTSPQAEAVQLQVYSAMPDEQRLLIAMEMSDLVRGLAKERIRSEHPYWSDVQIVRELIREAFLLEKAPSPLR